MLRDGLFALCQAHHNGAVGADSYGVFVNALLERSSYLIALELALAPLNHNRNDGSPPVDDEIAKLLGILKNSQQTRQAPGVPPGTMVQSERSVLADHLL